MPDSEWIGATRGLWHWRRALARSPVSGADPTCAAPLRDVSGPPLRPRLDGVLLIVWSTPGVFDTTTDQAYIHLARHQAAFGVALGVVFLVVAWRPDRAYGIVPMAAVFVVALTGAAIVDLAQGASSFSKESRHATG